MATDTIRVHCHSLYKGYRTNEHEGRDDMILGIGVDLLKKERIRSLIHNTDDPFFRRIYTVKEMEQAMREGNPVHYLAGRFSAKEAIFKCFKVSGNEIHLKDIEILRGGAGIPEVHLHGNAKIIAMEKGIKTIEISISHETEYVTTYATAIGEVK